MNSSVKSNMYSVARDHALERYGAHVIAASEPCSYQFCVVSYRKPSAAETQALENSAAALGYDKNGYFTLVVSPDESADAKTNASVLSPIDLFCLIEGIDPFAMVVADKQASSMLEKAYCKSDEPIEPSRRSNFAEESSKPNHLARPGEASRAAEEFSLPCDSYLHLLGRDTVIFTSFEAMLANPSAKQRAWALLKKLKRETK